MANAKETKKMSEQERRQQAINRMNDKVEITLFKDTGKYSEDVTVTINGVTYQIQRGVPVEVPRYVADIIRQSEKQDLHTANMIQKLTSEYEKKSQNM